MHSDSSTEIKLIEGNKPWLLLSYRFANPCLHYIIDCKNCENENHVKQKVKCADVFTEEINLWYLDFWREWIFFLFSLLVNCDWGWVVLRNSYAIPR